jgi:hypothetical protein
MLIFSGKDLAAWKKYTIFAELIAYNNFMILKWINSQQIRDIRTWRRFVGRTLSRR